MNIRTFIGVSLALNLGLLAFLALRPAPPPAPQPAPAARRIPVARVSTAAETVTNTQEVVVAGEAQKKDWRSVESPDFKEYITRLRAVGCPEETIRDIIIADVNKLYASKWKAMMMPAGGIRYWDPWDSSEQYYERTISAQRRDLEKEKRDLVRELLGVELDEEMRKQRMDWSAEDRKELLLSFLPEEKRRKLREIEANASRLTQELLQKLVPGPIVGEAQAQLAKIREDSAAEMKKILSPQELEQYELRASSTADGIRSTLGEFDVTEAEFIAIYRNRVAMQSNSMKPEDYRNPELMQQYAEKSRQMQDELRKQLGETRYAEYQKNQDYYYRDIQSFARQENLPKDTAGKVYDIKRAVDQQMSKLRMDQNLSTEARQAALQAIQKETEATLGTLLGNDAYKNYTRRSGTWVQRIGASPAPVLRSVIPVP